MGEPLEAAAVSVRLRLLWLSEIAGSRELAASDLADVAAEVELRRVGDQLVLAAPYDFGDGDPLDGGLGALLRRRAHELSEGAIQSVTWEYDDTIKPRRRARTDDLDICSPEDPRPDDYPELFAKVRKHIPTATSAAAQAVVDALRPVAVSRHRLWFAAPSSAERDALGSVPGARAALVTAIQRFQKQEVPLYRVVVDPLHWS